MATLLSTPEVLKAIQEDCWEGSSESDNNEDREDYTITDPLDIAQSSTVFTERCSREQEDSVVDEDEDVEQADDLPSDSESDYTVTDEATTSISMPSATVNPLSTNVSLTSTAVTPTSTNVTIHRKGFPTDLKTLTLKKRGEYKAVLVENAMVECVAWQDKKTVKFINTISLSTEQSEVKRKNKDGSSSMVACPQSVKKYNQYMGGVDMADAKRKVYSCSRKSVKWWLPE